VYLEKKTIGMAISAATDVRFDVQWERMHAFGLGTIVSLLNQEIWAWVLLPEEIGNGH